MDLRQFRIAMVDFFQNGWLVLESAQQCVSRVCELPVDNRMNESFRIDLVFQVLLVKNPSHESDKIVRRTRAVPAHGILVCDRSEDQRDGIEHIDNRALFEIRLEGLRIPKYYPALALQILSE